MKRHILLPAALAVFVVLTGCEALFNQENMFAGLEPNLAEQFSTNMSDDDLLSTLSDNSDSPSLYEDLAADPELTDILVTQLDGIVDTSTNPATVEEAAIYLSDIVLNTTEVGDVVNSLVEALIDSSSTSSTSSETAILDAVLAPVDNLISSGDEASFTEFINDILLLADTYDALAAVNDDTGSAISADLAQAAAVVLVMDAVVSAIDVNGDGNSTDETSADQIAALFDTLTALNGGDETASLELSTVFAFTDIVGTGSSLEILLTAAGLDSITSLIGQMGTI